MKDLSHFFVLFFVVTFLSGCKNCGDDPAPYYPCDEEVILSENLYQSARRDAFNLNSMSIEGNCLKLNFSAGGCSGDTWIVKLVDSESVLESYPPQRNLIFSLENDEECDAYITKEVSFDISALRYDRPPLRLNIVNANESILYEY